ncbi:uncharacterized protein LOC132035457 [Lycium ferocissimum]|uniref:uncharacterized protein LOC132035457 n=1 Tax=Lycium ferocissimum TaxID=112874 RepID=UPI002815A8A2|nr:uncharacterized protein LOC132035457 [Lycium ferocissimum]
MASRSILETGCTNKRWRLFSKQSPKEHQQVRSRFPSANPACEMRTVTGDDFAGDLKTLSIRKHSGRKKLWYESLWLLFSIASYFQVILEVSRQFRGIRQRHLDELFEILQPRVSS